MDPVAADPLLEAGNAIVTLDVLHSGVIWTWYVTMNFWAKSVATGVMLLLPWLLMKYEVPKLRLKAAIISVLFINITLLFTVLDLHQPFRFWHIFAYTQTRSVIALGAWLLTFFNFLAMGMAGLAFMKRDALYDKLLPVQWVLSFFATIYTAGLLGQANARELWMAPTETAQMLLAATLAGSAAFLLIGAGGEQARRPLGQVLGISAFVSATIFVMELVFGPQKSEEAQHLVHILTSGELATVFWPGLIVGFLVPIALVLVGGRKPSAGLMAGAAIASLIGLWLVKHAWLIAPQLVPLS
jgi:formate-dependent nitrite reductase membrane component NrfD